MQQDIYEAMLEYYPKFLQCSIQTFDDDKERKDKSLAGILQNNIENIEKVKLLNQKGAWIFFSVNPMATGKRDKESVVSVSSWICEVDGIDKGTQQKIISNAPIQPSLIIESNSSYHMYWFAKEGTKEKRNDIANGLRNFFDGDPAVVDISRVLRLPWFYHCKDMDNKFLISVYDYTGKYYTEEEMLKAYPNTKPFSQVKSDALEKEKIAKKDLWGDYFWDRVKAMDTVRVLERISWSYLVSNERISFKNNSNGTQQIYVNDKSTWAWIDRNGKIGSTNGGWPHRTNWVFRYWLCDWKELAKRIKDNFPEMCESDKIPKKEIKEEVITKKKQKIRRGYVYGNKCFDEFECMMDGELVVIAAETNSWKTTFAMDMIQENVKLGKKWLYINLEFAIETVWENRRLFGKGKRKTNLTDLDPLTPEEIEQKNKYVQEKLSVFDYHNEPKWLSLEKLIEVIIEYEKKGIWLFVVDSFSKIEGNSDWKNARTYQNKTMEVLQELCQKLQIVVVLLHHTNRQWVFEGSQKIMDLANVFITIKKETDFSQNSTIFTLTKDKFVSKKEIERFYVNHEYTKNVQNVLSAMW